MDLQLERDSDVTVVAVRSDFLDASNSGLFKERMAGVLEGASRVLLDLGAVQFIDSSGCGAILTCLKQLGHTGGELKICCVTNPVRALFDLVRMQRIIPVYSTRAEALASFHATGVTG